MKIRSKFRMVSLCIVLIMVGVVVAVYWVAKQELTERVHDHLILVADLQRERVKDVLERNFERLEQVSARRPLQDNLVMFMEDSLEDSRKTVNDILRDAEASGTGFTEVCIIESDGDVLGSSKSGNIDASFAEEPFFLERQMSADKIDDKGRAVYFGIDDDGELSVILSEPFRGEDGTELGLIVIRTSGANLSATISGEEGARDGDARAGGQAGDDGSVSGVQTILVKHDAGGGVVILAPAELAGTVSDVRPDGPLVTAADNHDRFFSDAHDVFRGKPVLAVTRSLGGEGMGLGFVAMIDRAVAFRGLHDIRNFSLAVLALALVALEFAFLAMRKGILKPIQQLAETATEISGGDLSRRVEVVGSDEIGELARDFNHMTERLIEANTGLERKVEERTAELEQSNADLAQFAYVASHDLKEPLRMVTSYVQLLDRRLGDKLDVESKEFMAFAVDGAKRMRGLIDDLLAFSRVGTKRKPFERVSSRQIVGAALMNLKIAVDECGAEIELGELPEVMADPTQLTQLFQNLIANAIKFRGDRKPVVHVGAQRDGAQWRFSVRDNGIGIEKEYLDQIFLIFQRLHKRTEYEGSGIGLAVCKKIVERHGGKITVESTPGEGTTFFFGIPAVDA